MKTLSLVIVCLLVVAAFVQAQDANNSSTLAPKPVDDTTTKAATTTVTTAGTTTSGAPATTTTPTEPKAGFWHVNNGSTPDEICILVNLGARFTFSYVDASNTTQKVKTDLPSSNTTTTAGGKCGNDSSFITLTYKDDCKMTLTFQKNSSKFSIKTVDLSFSNLTKCAGPLPSPPKKEVSPVTGSITNQNLFQATVGQSYLCNSEQTLTMNKTNITALEVEFADVQVQAFMSTKTLEFGTAQECPQDAETSNIVPIAVGAALAALVLIVLIAYLISRNRGQRGYESV